MIGINNDLSILGVLSKIGYTVLVGEMIGYALKKDTKFAFPVGLKVKLLKKLTLWLGRLEPKLLSKAMS